MEYCCKDCRFYLPVDVFQGLCKIEKTTISPDDLSCKKFERQSKCKFCAHYVVEKDFLGRCMGITLASPDLNASKCADFTWLPLN